VNNVCFPFPLPFFFPPPAPAAASADAAALSLLAPGPAPHAPGPLGAAVPNIFRKDWFPPTGAFCRAAGDGCNSGNNVFDSFGGAFELEAGICVENGVTVLCDEPLFGGGTKAEEAAKVGAGAAGRPEALADQGVLRCPGRGAVDEDATADAGPSAGKRCVEEDAAWATRSHTCVDCRPPRPAVACLAFRTRPLAMPA
jgi:hypothetical protein